MLFNLEDNFYSPSDLGLMVMNFLNLPFVPSHQPNETYFGTDRLKAYPCYETSEFKIEKNPYAPFDIFKKTLELKTVLKPFKIKTFLRKTKLSELKKSPSWNQYKPHQDDKTFDYAGIVYFNSNSLIDGTKFFHNENCFEPTAVIGSRYNRCVFYSSQVFHSPTMEQEVEERWIQPFFLITKEETYNNFKKNNAV